MNAKLNSREISMKRFLNLDITSEFDKSQRQQPLNFVFVLILTFLSFAKGGIGLWIHRKKKKKELNIDFHTQIYFSLRY